MTGGVLMGRTGYETRRNRLLHGCAGAHHYRPGHHGRAFGEKILGAMTPEQREKKMLAQDLADMRKAIQRRREHMARQVLLTGKLSMFVYTNEGRGLKPTVLADYGFTQNFTPDTTWDNAGAKIEADMQEMTDMVFEGLGAPEKIVMAPDVANAMLENSKYMKQFDMLSAKLGEINARYKGEGVRFLGYNADGVEMYSFSGKFLDDDGQMKTCRQRHPHHRPQPAVKDAARPR